jgi:hypothetical protein
VSNTRTGSPSPATRADICGIAQSLKASGQRLVFIGPKFGPRSRGGLIGVHCFVHFGNPKSCITPASRVRA